MSIELGRLKREASQLGAAERAALVEHLIRSLDEEAGPADETAWTAELNRRVADLEAGRVQEIPAETVHRRIEERFRR